MAQICTICEKKSLKGWYRVKLRGKYNPTTKRKQLPNLQWFRVTPGLASKLGFPENRRIRVCTKCLKTYGKTQGSLAT